MIFETDIQMDDRCWVFQSKKMLSQKFQQELLSQLHVFQKEWKTHGKLLKSGVKILYNHFVVVWVESAFQNASGCSIDQMIGFFQKIDRQYHLEFFNRLNLAFEENHQIIFLTIPQAKERIKKNQFSENSYLFNNSISNGKQFIQNWKINPYQSWLNR
ncbi:MAG: hypothetical protein VXX63_01830 [Bacteroidota bacterium]|nr:hypothetical protein [Bacteroidota bacterium]